MNHQGWEKLLCNYFYAICLRVLSFYFSGFGFSSVKSKRDCIVFRNGEVFIEVNYYLEDAPNYTLSVVIGIGKEAYNEHGRFTGIPVWSIIPENSAANELLLQTFSNETELADLLLEVQTKILEPYVKPLWTDRAKLEEELKRFSAG